MDTSSKELNISMGFKIGLFLISINSSYLSFIRFQYFLDSSFELPTLNILKSSK
jgi:hypothetical protein